MGERVLLGVCGGIAAYKAAELARSLTSRGYDVRVVLTDAATEFVSPLTFSSLTGKPAVLSVFDQGAPLAHIELAEADIAVVAPCTGNMLAKVAHGVADDALSTILLAYPGPLLLCPAMNVHMWESDPIQQAIPLLESRGVVIVGPEEGELACGAIGWGRLAPVSQIEQAIDEELRIGQIYEGRSVLVTAGPTRERIDDVRFITNASSGRMGYEIARVAKRMGAAVTLISGPTTLLPPTGIEFLSIESAAEMHDAVVSNHETCDVLVMAAAVADARPKRARCGKVRKADIESMIELEPTVDILSTVASRKGDRVHVGFALETDDVEKNASEKLRQKELDVIVGNTPEDALGSDLSSVLILTKDGGRTSVKAVSKRVIARHVLEHAATYLLPRPKKS